MPTIEGKDAVVWINDYVKKAGEFEAVAKALRTLMKKAVRGVEEYVNPWKIPSFDSNGPLCCGSNLTSVMRVSPDGSTLLFSLPEQVYPDEIAPAGTGLNILGPSSVGGRRVHVQMYHFDSHANLIAQNQVTIPIRPTEMAVLPSGRTILAGHSNDDPHNHDDRKYGFAVLDENDKVLRSIYLPLPPGGRGWTFAGSRMVRERRCVCDAAF